ncbi:unnamed protein product, partial [Phaeothamnion confervicola]
RRQPTAKHVPPGNTKQARNARGRTALHLACLRAHDHVVSLLLDSGADPLARDGEGHQPCDLLPATVPQVKPIL